MLEFFLKTGLTSAHLRMSGNLDVKIPSLKLCIINSEETSRFALFLLDIPFCSMALDRSDESISLLTSFISTAEKQKCTDGFPSFLLQFDDFQISRQYQLK